MGSRPYNSFDLTSGLRLPEIDQGNRCNTSPIGVKQSELQLDLDPRWITRVEENIRSIRSALYRMPIERAIFESINLLNILEKREI